MIRLPKTTAGKSLLILAIIALMSIVVCNLCGAQIYEFVMGGLHYTSEKEADQQIVKLQAAVDAQCGVGIAVISNDGFWSETPRRPEYGWSNDRVSCHGDDRLQENQIQCTCSK